ncbi:MAG: FecR family protein [Planctomycetes bacterium]|nr:FecR family protein [Planctomycetota bacterium]
MTPESQEELVRLLGELVEGTATADDQKRIRALVADDADAREYYYAFIRVHAHLLWKHGAVASQAERQSVLSEGIAMPSTRLTAPQRTARTFFRTAAAAFWHPIALMLVAGLISTGILAYVLWPGPAQQPVAKQTPAAKIANQMDANWEAAFSPADNNVLTSGQRLILQSGSAEITFNSQARVVLEGPAELTIVDAGVCRLADGKLVAHVPEPAKGFKVHTPDGTVTDLGTEFGVYVDARTDQQESREEEQQPGGGPQIDAKQPPITEVHVFKGKVDVSRSEVGNRKSEAVAQNPTPDLQPPTSTILSAGQAVTISANKVQSLPAADPFKFAIDKLQGKPRHVLLSEDFEAYDLARQVKSFGPWIVQSGTRKGQGVSVENPAESIAAANAEVDVSIQLPPPPTLVGSRVANFGTSPQNSTDTYPVLSREIDGKLLAKKCQVLVEFDFFPRSDEPQLSLALATEVGHTAGIELWRSVDAAKQGVDAAKQGVDAAKKVAFVAYRWYRMRVLLSVADGVVSEVRVDRSQWRGPEGWVRDLSYQPPTPKLDWSTPPRYAIFGFPVVSPATVGGVFWLDNIRIEVIAEK